MSRPAVFFDRDNTLIVNSEYLGDPAQVELIPGAPEAVARARGLGFAIVVVSNQSGVARGMFTEDDVRAVNARMDAALLEADNRAVVDRHEFCPHHPKGKVPAYATEHERRKPRPGMFFDAAKALDLDLARSWLVGDAPRDIVAGKAAGCRTILLRETFRTASPAAAETTGGAEPDYTASSLLDAIDFIEMNLEPVAAAKPEPPAEPATRLERERAAATQIASAFAAEPKVHATSRHPIPAPTPASTPTDWSSTPVRAEDGPGLHRGDRESTLLLERIVDELRRANEPPQDFSIARMFGALVQGFALAAFAFAIFFRDQPAFTPFIAAAIFLQLLVSSLFLMAR